MEIATTTFQGNPCKRGHSGLRYRANKACVVCDRQYSRERRRRLELPVPTRAPIECEICGITPEENGRELALDHDHETGEFRGWLCWQCNMAIAKLGDNTEGLKKALAYLERAGV